jgi:hypothetical protein
VSRGANISTGHNIEERSGIANTAGDDELAGKTAKRIGIVRAGRNTVA